MKKHKEVTPDPKATRIAELEQRLEATKKELTKFASEIITLNATNTQLNGKLCDALNKNNSYHYEQRDIAKKWAEERERLDGQRYIAEQNLQALRSYIIEYFAAMSSEGGVPLPRQVAMQRRLAGLPPLGYNPNGCSIEAKTVAEFPPGGHW